MTLKGDVKLKWKLTRDLKNDKEFDEFSCKQLKVWKFAVDWFLFSKAYKTLDEKLQKSYLSWHWSVMENLKKNWLLVSKMTWQISQILMREFEIVHFDVLLLSMAYKVLAKKVQKIYLSWRWRVIQTLIKTSLFVWKMT